MSMELRSTNLKGHLVIRGFEIGGTHLHIIRSSQLCMLHKK